jgi:RNA polymerase-binding transcription factor DksA
MISKAEAAAYRLPLLALRSRLNRDRSQLEDEALRGTGGEAAGGLSDIPLHLTDLGSQGFEAEMTLGLLESEEQLSDEINAALDRLDQGAYGRCATCGQGISSERLQALPYAGHCMACARKLTRKAAP